MAVIWFGLTSNCCASSSIFLSTLIAAKATFALKAGDSSSSCQLLIPGENLRRRQARKPTYVAVRICGTSSFSPSGLAVLKR